MEAEKEIKKGNRVIATTLTKRMAEDLSEYFKERGVKAQYLHSDIKTIDRIKILTGFRRGEFDCIVGVNLLREGLDLPEVTLIGILDADKEGFLRSETALIQIIGRAARNVNGRVILYADKITDSMNAAIGETERRRVTQLAHNEAHGIVPRSIVKAMEPLAVAGAEVLTSAMAGSARGKAELEREMADVRKRMRTAAAALDFEQAARLRDEARALERVLLAIG